MNPGHREARYSRERAKKRTTKRACVCVCRCREGLVPIPVDVLLTQSLPQTEAFAFPLDLHLQLLQRTLRTAGPFIALVVGRLGTRHGRRNERTARVDRRESRVPCCRSCPRRRRAARVGILSERGRGRRIMVGRGGRKGSRNGRGRLRSRVGHRHARRGRRRRRGRRDNWGQ